MPPDPFWSSRTFLYISQVEGNAYRIRVSPASKEEMVAYDWAKMDFGSDPETNRRILERVAQWRQATLSPAESATAQR